MTHCCSVTIWTSHFEPCVIEIGTVYSFEDEVCNNGNVSDKITAEKFQPQNLRKKFYLEWTIISKLR